MTCVAYDINPTSVRGSRPFQVRSHTRDPKARKPKKEEARIKKKKKKKAPTFCEAKLVAKRDYLQRQEK